ncbi:MAG: ABC transporter substrate-binding protein [Clostridiales bacterium]|jgi:peptide/nickel transport system substrate-binding protein|nr:ABC transporter substrate-binding protein [Clostridiales bacterium]
MKKLLAVFTAALLFAAGCGASGAGPAGNGPSGLVTPPSDVEIVLLGYAGQENDLNLVRDQFSKSGFNVSLNLQPDYASFLTQLEAGNYSFAINGWTTVTGNPDYAVRSLFRSDGDYNRSGIDNPEVDRLIELAASQTPQDYVATYKELENVLVTQNAYIIPLYANLKTQAFNKELLKPGSVRLSKSRSMVWEDVDYADESKRDTQPLQLCQSTSTLTSLDPVKGNDGSINMLNTNMYVRLVNLTDDDKVTSEGSLSYQNVIASGNSDYYFVLRDDINFAKVENREAVDTGERVGAEDVVFSLKRANNKDSVPNHRTYSLHGSMKEMEIVTDISALDSVTESGTDLTLRDALESATPTAIKELTDDKTKVDNAAGVYQVVKVTTNIPFPQVLNYLAHQSAGIVSKSQVEAVNTYDLSAYDVTKDIAYGDQSTITEGATYDNTLYASGPYIALYKNDYEIIFQRNPGYMPSTVHYPKIKTVDMNFIADSDAQLSALRSGEIYALYSVPAGKYDLVTGDPKLSLQEIPSNAVLYMLSNINGSMSDLNLRLALMYTINQEDFLAFYQNKYFRAFTTLSPLVNTGNVLTQDYEKANEYLKAYIESR